MTKNTSSKVVAGVVGLSLALALFVGVGASSASAQSSTMSFADLIRLFIQLGIIAPEKANAALAAINASASVSFSRDLTVGSTGSDVTALQTTLGVSPATGYFGVITKAAVMSYQTAHGIPSTGYFGPLTRASVNGSMTTTTTTTTTTTGGTTVINTGVEGTLSVDKASVSNTTVYEGQSMMPVIAFKATAKISDITLQRVRLNLGTSASIYTKIYKTFYLVDDSGRVLAQADLNSNTVTKDNGTYLLNLSGFSYVVAKDSSKILTVKADLYSSIDSTDRVSGKILTIPADGVRGVDGAGIDQTGPTGSTITQSIQVSASLVDSANVLLSTNSANYKTTEVVGADGSNDDEYDRLPLLAFDLKAQKDNVTLTDLTVKVLTSGSTADGNTIYLMDGSNIIDSESLTNGSTSNQVTFDDLDYVISKDSTKTLTLRADIRNAVTAPTIFSARIVAADVVAENSEGDNADVSGSAVGENMVVRAIGPVFAINSKSISKSQSAEIANNSTTTVKATFDLSVKAVGNDITFGLQNGSSTFNFAIYKDGASTTVQTASSTSFSVPSNGVTTSGHPSGAFTLNESDSAVSVPVEFVFVGNNLALGSYAVGLESVKWATSISSSTQQTTSFMAGNIDWRTSTVQLP